MDGKVLLYRASECEMVTDGGLCLTCLEIFRDAEEGHSDENETKREPDYVVKK
jgi:hypothetical protein